MNITLDHLTALEKRCYEPLDKNDLVDIRDIEVNQNLPVTERILEFISLAKNPYLYKYGDKVVRIKFSSTDVTIEDRIKGYFQML